MICVVVCVMYGFCLVFEIVCMSLYVLLYVFRLISVWCLYLLVCLCMCCFCVLCMISVWFLNVLGLSRPPMDQKRVERRMQLIAETGHESGWSDLGISSDQWLMLVDRCVQTALDKENHFRQE